MVGVGPRNVFTKGDTGDTRMTPRMTFGMTPRAIQWVKLGMTPGTTPGMTPRMTPQIAPLPEVADAGHQLTPYAPDFPSKRTLGGAGRWPLVAAVDDPCALCFHDNSSAR